MHGSLLGTCRRSAVVLLVAGENPARAFLAGNLLTRGHVGRLPARALEGYNSIILRMI
jgi:hypothetical protein